MLAEAKRSEIRLLLAAGVLQKRIAELTGVSVRTISRIGQERSGPATPSPGEVPKPAGPGRPSTVEQYRDTVASMLRDDPKLKVVEVLRRLREDGYTGGKSAVYDLVKPLRSQVVRTINRFDGVAGEFSQHGFGDTLVEWTGGGRTRVKFFASRLKYSRYAVVTCVPNERVETLIRTLAAHFWQIGGLPLLAVFDRPKSVVAKSDPETGSVLAWNPTLAEVTARLGVAMDVRLPHQPYQNGSAESPVGWVRKSFFKARRFLDDDDLQAQLQDWHEEVNERRPSRATGCIPGEQLRAEEMGRLRPLKVAPEQLDLRYPVRVGPTGMVTYETNHYSMPAKAVGLSATLHLYRDRVVIEAGPYQAEHPRLNGGHEASILAAHRDELLAAENGKDGRMDLKRQRLVELGRGAKRVIPDLVLGWVRSN